MSRNYLQRPGPPALSRKPAPTLGIAPKRLRGKGLQTVRRRILTANPLCVQCDARGVVRAATEIDHIVPLSRGGPDDDSNRQALCSECHAAKTAAEARGGIPKTRSWVA